jgi:hypothetical protein
MNRSKTHFAHLAQSCRLEAERRNSSLMTLAPPSLHSDTLCHSCICCNSRGVPPNAPLDACHLEGNSHTRLWAAAARTNVLNWRMAPAYHETAPCRLHCPARSCRLLVEQVRPRLSHDAGCHRAGKPRTSWVSKASRSFWVSSSTLLAAMRMQRSICIPSHDNECQGTSWLSEQGALSERWQHCGLCNLSWHLWYQTHMHDWQLHAQREW